MQRNAHAGSPKNILPPHLPRLSLIFRQRFLGCRDSRARSNLCQLAVSAADRRLALSYAFEIRPLGHT